MSKIDAERSNADRRKRINRLKKEILAIICILIIVPWILCIFLFVKLRKSGNEEKGEAITKQEEIADNANENVEEDMAPGEPGGTYFVGGIEAESTEDEEPSLETDADSYNQEIETTGTYGSEDGLKRVYLTFDDGPSTNTEAILDILDEYDIKATFFVVGKTDEHSISMYKEIVKRGHTLGMHSFSHVYSDIYESVDAFTEDLERISGYLYGITGVKPFVYRFPGGSSNKVSSVNIRDCIEVLNEKNIPYFDWNSQTGDASKNSPEPKILVANALKNISKMDNVVILMHDAAGRKNTVEALPVLIERILALDDVVFLPITGKTPPIQHIKSDK